MNKNRYYKKIALTTAVTAVLSAGSSAHASIIDAPVFKILGAVVVWGGDGTGTGASVQDFIVNPSGTNVDIISGNVTPVMTGTLDSYAPTGDASLLTVSNTTFNDNNTNGIMDAGDTFAPFSPTETIGHSVGSQSSSFYVASNTSFDIKAVAVLDAGNSSAGASLSDISRSMTVSASGNAGSIAFGSAAQFPHSGATSTSGVSQDGGLDLISSETTVFTGDQRTASASGTIAEQSVQFTNSYTINSAVGLAAGTSEVAATVTYTVAIP